MPDLATRQLLLFVHRLMASPPPPRTPKYALHYRIAFSVVVLGFLSYNMVEALRAMEPSFYDILSVHPDVDETELKQAFKLFARRHHPDRGGSEDYFILGRTALQTLKDPIKRFAYDRYGTPCNPFSGLTINRRFGPESATWSHCKTIPDYLHQGLIKSSGYHIVTGSGLFIWSSIQSSSVTFVSYKKAPSRRITQTCSLVAISSISERPCDRISTRTKLHPCNLDIRISTKRTISAYSIPTSVILVLQCRPV